MHFAGYLKLIFIVLAGTGIGLSASRSLLSDENLQLFEQGAQAQEELISHAPQYHLAGMECSYAETDCAAVSFLFQVEQSALHKVPQLRVVEQPDLARTVVTFYGVSDQHGTFQALGSPSNPLIEMIDHQDHGNDHVVTFHRNGPLTPVEVVREGSRITIKFHDAINGHPFIESITPAPGAGVDLEAVALLVEAQLSAPLGSARLFVNGEPAALEVGNVGTYFYEFAKSVNLKEKQNYQALFIVTDLNGRSTSEHWEFAAGKNQNPNQDW